MKKKKILWVGIGSGCLLILACIGIGIVLWLFSNSSKYIISNDRETENIQVNIISPLSVKRGEEFVVEMQITNTSKDSQELDSIDIYRNYLDGMNLNRADPAHKGFREVTFGSHYFSYDFKREISANSMTKEMFHMTALKTGDYSGLVFICINSPTLCDMYHVRTIIFD